MANLKKIGVMWLRKSKNGNSFLSGSIELEGQKTKFIVFKNNRKEQDKHPDYEMFLSEEKPQEQPLQEAAPSEDMPF